MTPKLAETDPEGLTLAPIAPAPTGRGVIARHAFTFLLLGLLFTAFSPIFVRLSEIGPVATAAYRLALPLPLFFAVLWLRPQDRIATTSADSRHDVWLVLLSGVFFAGDLLFWNSSVMLTTVANASLLANITPVYVVLGSWLLFKDRPGPLFLVGMVVALGGSAVMMMESQGVAGRSIAGDVSAMVASAFYAGYVLTLSRVRKRVSIVATMGIGGAVAAAILALIAVFAEDQLLPHTLNGWMLMAAMALFAQVMGQLFIALSLAYVPPGLVATMFLGQPAIPALTAWALFNESITIYQVVGGVALLAGLEISRRGAVKA